MARSKDLWRILTLHCNEASRLSSESLDHSLSRADLIAWRLHLLACRSCRRDRRDILLLRQISRQASEPVEVPGSVLPDQVRERIRQSIKDQGLLD
jgi:hypothetical protein